MQKGCLTNLCNVQYTSKPCKCYPKLPEDINTSDLSPEQKSAFINSNQYCAYADDDGFLFPCDPGCCKLKCPGQCDDVPPRPPESLDFRINESPDNKKVRPVIELWLVTTVCLVCLSVLLKGA